MHMYTDINNTDTIEFIYIFKVKHILIGHTLKLK